MADHDIMLTTLGLVILDEVHFPNKDAVTDVLGGSGTYI